MDDLVLVDKKDSYAIVTLNRPDAMNALSGALMLELTQVFVDLQNDREIAAVVLTGAGRAFCAGLDLRELAAGTLLSGSETTNVDLQTAIAGFDRPIIGAVNGVAATGGFELALWCDLLIASPEARFADTHARVGIVPGWGLSQRLQRIIGINRARELAFTGNFLSADKAEAWGLVNRVVSAEELLPTCEALATDMASCDRTTLIRYRRVMNDGAGMDLASGLKHEAAVSALHAKTQPQEALAGRGQEVIDRGKKQAAD